MSIVWVNDELVDESQARISPLDHGFTVADGVFETLKITHGEVFAIDRHLTRLQKSAHGLGLGDIDLNTVSKAVSETLAANEPLEHGRLRITITSGTGPLGSNRGNLPVTTTVVTGAVSAWPETTSIAIVPWRRNERSAITGLKTTSYAENVRALEAAHTVGFSEAIFLDTKDRLSEGTGTNVFFVSNNVVYTPSVACGILEGITRELVMELCSITSIAVVEGEFSTSDLIAADEVFITSSTRDVHPVTRIALLNDLLDIYTEYSFEVGPVTAQLRDAWVQQFSKNLNP